MNAQLSKMICIVSLCGVMLTGCEAIDSARVTAENFKNPFASETRNSTANLTQPFIMSEQLKQSLNPENISAVTKVQEPVKEWLAQEYSTPDALLTSSFSQFYLAKDQSMIAPLEMILSRLVEAWPYKKPQKLQIVLFHSKDARAFATPKYEIWVSTGAYRDFDESQMAAVLAHELSHLLLHHMEDQKGAQKRAKVVREMVESTQSVMKYAKYAKQTKALSSTGGDVRAANNAGDHLDSRMLQIESGTGVLVSLDSQVGQAIHGISEEFEADTLAYDLLAVSGYSPVGLIDAIGYFEQAHAEYLANMKGISDQLQDNVAQLRSIMEGDANLAEMDQTLFDPTELLGKMKDKAFEKMYKAILSTHPAYDARLSALAAYDEMMLSDENQALLRKKSYKKSRFMAKKSQSVYQQFLATDLAVAELNIAIAGGQMMPQHADHKAKAGQAKALARRLQGAQTLKHGYFAAASADLAKLGVRGISRKPADSLEIVIRTSQHLPLKHYTKLLHEEKSEFNARSIQQIAAKAEATYGKAALQDWDSYRECSQAEGFVATRDCVVAADKGELQKANKRKSFIDDAMKLFEQVTGG